ncbi:GAF domain-containing protein [Cryptosporangium phraense]|uniref:GAF domain-containing protein n=1 Tax=Cryptosporangium phraense TaxID=2593070 RepID=A0A545AME5_9ACTN|nr:GAF domain-containing protein [Cryptosporangium phraense]TQS42420.1 GAF domain-containing protein [Cryptosporangium phraense]
MSTLLHHRLADRTRLTALANYDLDDPHLRQQLDAIAMRTAMHLHMPTAMTTLMLDNAAMIAGAHGVEGWMRSGGAPAEWAFCAQTVLTGEPYIVSDATSDPMQCTNPAVELDGVRAYAGAPLITPSGQVLGAHCVIEQVPHVFSADEIAELQAAAADVVIAFEQHPSRHSPEYRPSFFTN